MVQSDALKKAKAKYYQKIKDDPNYKEKCKINHQEYYGKNKDKHLENCKKYYEQNKEKLLEMSKEKRDKSKLKNVMAKLENLTMEDVAKILIEARKTNLIDI